MKLSIHLFLITFLVVFVINLLVVQARELRRSNNQAIVTSSGQSEQVNQSEQVEGLTGVRGTSNGNIELDFDFNCSSINCQSTLHDDDGLASITTVLSEMQREGICDRSSVMDERDWNVVKSFLKGRLEHLKNYCREKVCEA